VQQRAAHDDAQPLGPSLPCAPPTAPPSIPTPPPHLNLSSKIVMSPPHLDLPPPLHERDGRGGGGSEPSSNGRILPAASCRAE
jgi:hypothetical protein